MPGRKTNIELRTQGAQIPDDKWKDITDKLIDKNDANNKKLLDEFNDLRKRMKENENASTKSKEQLSTFLNNFSKINNELNEFINRPEEDIKNFLKAFNDFVHDIDTRASKALNERNEAKSLAEEYMRDAKIAHGRNDKKAEEDAKFYAREQRERQSKAQAEYRQALKERQDYAKEYHVIEDKIRKDIGKSENSARIIKREATAEMDRMSKDIFSLIGNFANSSKMDEVLNNLQIKTAMRVKEPALVDSMNEMLIATFKDGFKKDGPFRKAFIDIIQKGILNGISKNLNNIVGGGSMNMPFFSSVLPGFNSASMKDIIKERMENPAKFYREYGKDFAAGGTLMKEATASSFQDKYKDFGISERDLAKAMGELNKQMADFSYKYTPAMRDELKEVVVSLEKAGIASNISAKALSDLSRVFNINSTTSSIYVRDLAALGKAMNVNDKVIQDLTSNSGKLAHLNENTLKRSIVDLSIASNKLGIELGTLLGQVGNFQTFEGAAAAAGELNIALGGQFIDGLGLMKDSIDDPMKAIQRLKSGFEQAGKSVDALDPAQIKYYASAFKLSEEDFKKYFRSTNQEMMQYSADMKKKADSEKNFQTMMIKSRDAFMEVTNAFFSAFNGESIEYLKDLAGYFGKFLNFSASILNFIGPGLTATTVAGFAFMSMLYSLKLLMNGLGLMSVIRGGIGILGGAGAPAAAAAGGAGIAGATSGITTALLGKGARSILGGVGGGLAGLVIGTALESQKDKPNMGRVLAEFAGSAIGGILAGLAGTLTGPGAIAAGIAGSAGGGYLGAKAYDMFAGVEDGVIVSRPGQKPSVIPISSSDSVKLIAGKPGGPIENSSSSKDNGELASLLKELISKIDGISERPINVDLDGKRVSSALYELNRRSPYNK